MEKLVPTAIAFAVTAWAITKMVREEMGYREEAGMNLADLACSASQLVVMAFLAFVFLCLEDGDGSLSAGQAWCVALAVPAGLACRYSDTVGPFLAGKFKEVAGHGK